MAIKVRSGGQWLPVSGGGGEPVGTILMWAGSISSIPSGYKLCDGSAISRSDYSALFTAIGTINGVGDGSTTFNIPDLRDKFVVGATADGLGNDAYPGVSPAKTGGQKDASLPSHYHNMPGDDQLYNADGKSGGTQFGTTPTWSNSSDDNFNYDATSTLSGNGKLWRTGANESTEITFFRDIKIDSKTVPSGRYTLYTIPDETTWTIIINKKLNTWGAYAYDSSQDLLRVKVPVEYSDETLEAFSITIKGKGSSAFLHMGWDNLRVKLPMDL